MRILVVTNMYPTPQHPTSGIFVEQQVSGLKEIGLDVEVMHVDRTKGGMRVYFGLGQRVRAKVLEYQPDIIHAMYGGTMADQVVRACTDKATVVTFHGSDLLGQHLAGRTREVIAYYGVRASWRAARKATGVVTVSHRLRDTLPEDVDRSKVQVIPCGISLELFKPMDRDKCCQELGWKPDRFNILFAANTSDPVKRPQLARAAIESLSKMGIEADIHYLSGVAYRSVPVWLNASDCLLLTSLHEGSPTIIKEALACNVPIVSVDVGDVRERIQGIQGCYIAAPEPDELASKLAAVRSSARRLNGRNKIKNLSLEQVALRLKDFYNALLMF